MSLCMVTVIKTIIGRHLLFKHYTLHIIFSFKFFLLQHTVYYIYISFSFFCRSIISVIIIFTVVVDNSIVKMSSSLVPKIDDILIVPTPHRKTMKCEFLIGCLLLFLIKFCFCHITISKNPFLFSNAYSGIFQNRQSFHTGSNKTNI